MRIIIKMVSSFNQGCDMTGFQFSAGLKDLGFTAKLMHGLPYKTIVHRTKFCRNVGIV